MKRPTVCVSCRRKKLNHRYLHIHRQPPVCHRCWQRAQVITQRLLGDRRPHVSMKVDDAIEYEGWKSRRWINEDLALPRARRG